MSILQQSRALQRTLGRVKPLKALFRNQFGVRRFSYHATLMEIRQKSMNGGVKDPQLKTLMDVLFTDLLNRPLDQPIFIQAVEEVMKSLRPFFLLNPKYLEVLPTLVIPEKVAMFACPWVDDLGMQRVNNGYRVQFNQHLGPYKGGLRFHPQVNLGIIKFLGFEQTFKNALTGLPIGGAKGGADFNPKGKSEREIFKFCRSFMTGLSDYIGPDRDVPAGDIGVGQKEIGFMYGQYKRMTKNFHGVLTGKRVGWGGSHLRPEATGYGLVYITDCHLKTLRDTLKGKMCLVSGSGNVAQFAAEKLMELGAKVICFSDSKGTIVNENGFTKEQLEKLKELKTNRKRCEELKDVSSQIQYLDGKTPWNISLEADLAFPCATENEVGHEEAKDFMKRGIKGVFEGANMPLTNQAVDILVRDDIDYIPGKAANAGGVAVSCLEMAQNSARMVWSKEKVDKLLHQIMESIYRDSAQAARELGDEGNIQLGANTVGFKRVADAMFHQGTVFRADF